jgi:signal transduction histidine kinase/ABC-type uncharacterized transport system substrate-binding protein
MKTLPFGGTRGSPDCVGALRWITLWICICCITSVAMGIPVQSADTATEKNILVLCSFTAREAFAELEPLKKTVRSRVPVPVNFYVEYLESQRFGDPGYRESLKETIRQAYRGKQIDLVVVDYFPALQFAIDYRDQIVPGIPIVFMGIAHQRLPRGAPWPGVTGVTTPEDVGGSIDLALQFHPDTQNVAVVAGDSEFEKYWLNAVEEDLRRRHDKLHVINVQSESTKQMFEQVSRLTPHTVVFFQQVPEASSQQQFGPYDVLAAIAQRVPTYSIWPLYIDHGAIGGSYNNDERSGTMAGEQAARVLSGEKPENIPIIYNSVPQIKIDWRQLRRWNIPESAIPPGAMVVNREPGPWEKYKMYISGSVLLLILLLSLVFYLLAERKQKRRTQDKLADRLRFETFLAEVSALLANPGTPGADNAIHECLRKVGTFFRGGSASIWQRNADSSTFVRTYGWSELPEVFLREVPASYFSNTIRRLADGEDVYFSNEMQIRQFVEGDEFFQRFGVKAFLATPIRGDGQFLGALSLSNHETEMTWPPDFVSRLHVIAEILGNVLARKLAEQAVMDSESLTDSILDSLQSSVAVVDKEGVILDVNKHWLELVNERSVPQLAAGPVGSNYIDEWVKTGLTEETTETIHGIKTVLSGSRQLFEKEYSYESQSERKWFRMVVTQLLRGGTGAVISYLEITSQKLVEIEQSRMREEVAHINRAQEMGQLAASLTHELAQPLAAVLSNAQAAARLTTRTELDVLEIQEILDDIIKDDKRACAVLDNVRGILKRHTVKPHTVNLNGIVEDIALIVRTDALLNGVQFRSMLSPDALFVQGDEVPLQQVLLNLVNNAIAAMRQMPRERKTLTVRTQIQNGFGLLLVEDEGPGIPDALKEKLFLPFFTTKSEGLGMGLSICASILESFGGSIRFAERPGGGTVFTAQLHLAQSPDQR